MVYSNRYPIYKGAGRAMKRIIHFADKPAGTTSKKKIQQRLYRNLQRVGFVPRDDMPILYSVFLEPNKFGPVKEAVFHYTRPIFDKRRLVKNFNFI